MFHLYTDEYKNSDRPNLLYLLSLMQHNLNLVELQKRAT